MAPFGLPFGHHLGHHFSPKTLLQDSKYLAIIFPEEKGDSNQPQRASVAGPKDAQKGSTWAQRTISGSDLTQKSAGFRSDDPKMIQSWSKDDPKMIQRWSKDGTKMVRRCPKITAKEMAQSELEPSSNRHVGTPELDLRSFQRGTRRRR